MRCLRCVVWLFLALVLGLVAFSITAISIEGVSGEKLVSVVAATGLSLSLSILAVVLIVCAIICVCRILMMVLCIAYIGLTIWIITQVAQRDWPDFQSDNPLTAAALYAWIALSAMIVLMTVVTLCL